jgi:hypothetical protein
MHLTHAMSPAGIKQNTLCCSGFAGIDVRHDSDVSGIFQVAVHKSFFLPLGRDIS